MNLVDLRDRLKTIDAALSEIQKWVNKAGSELIKANAGIGTIIGEGDSANGRATRTRRARKPKATEQADQRGATDGQEQTALTTAPQVNVLAKRGRGRPKAPEAEEEEEGSSELATEAS